MAENGYFVVARSIWDHPALTDDRLRTVKGEFSRREAWLWLLSEAAWKAGQYRAGPIVVELERGQVGHATRYMAKAWQWPQSTVCRFLERLEKCSMTASHTGSLSGSEITIITICNYDKYQLGGVESGSENGSENGSTAVQPRFRKEEDKKERKESTAKNPKVWPPDAFDQWWSRVPKKADKLDAKRKLLRVQASGDISFEDFLAATDRWNAAMRGTEQQFIKAPPVWLNKGGYLDEGNARSRVAAFPAQDPTKLTDDQWRSRVMGFAQNQRWAEAWGSAPDKPGCLVPATILTQYGYIKGSAA